MLEGFGEGRAALRSRSRNGVLIENHSLPPAMSPGDGSWSSTLVEAAELAARAALGAGE
jgi:hypothetical protein